MTAHVKAGPQRVPGKAKKTLAPGTDGVDLARESPEQRGFRPVRGG